MQPGLYRASHADGSDSYRNLQHQRGGRAVTAITGLPTGVPGRVAALSILCALIGLGYAAIIAPLIDAYRSGEATLTNRELLIPKLEHLATELPALRAR